MGWYGNDGGDVGDGGSEWDGTSGDGSDVGDGSGGGSEWDGTAGDGSYVGDKNGYGSKGGDDEMMIFNSLVKCRIMRCRINSTLKLSNILNKCH